MIPRRGSVGFGMNRRNRMKSKFTIRSDEVAEDLEAALEQFRGTYEAQGEEG